MRFGRERRRLIINRTVKNKIHIKTEENNNCNKEENNAEYKKIQKMNQDGYYTTFNLCKEEFKKINIPIIKKMKEKCDLLLVIPIRNRDNILDVCLNFTCTEIKKSHLNIKIVVVEHDIDAKSKTTAEKYEVEHLFIKSNGEIFNKCLCHNLGSLVYDSKFIMFHDVDLVSPPNLFDSIFNNLGTHKAIQCFNGRRVIYVNQDNSERFKKDMDMEFLRNSQHRIGEPGAPGGSIMLERELYENIGGFDHIFFWGYSIEDGFFWKKMEVYGEVTTCSNPIVEMYHLWHEPNHRTNPLLIRDHELYRVFNTFNRDEKIKYLNIAKDEYKKLKDYVIS